MADKETLKPEPVLPEAQALAQGLGMLVHNTLNRHWFSSTDERETLVEYYALVSGCLTRSEELAFRLVGEVLSVNGTTATVNERYAQTLTVQMQIQQAGNFACQSSLEMSYV